MTPFPRILSILLLSLILTACETSDFKAPVRQWDYNARAERTIPAEAPPKTLADIQREQLAMLESQQNELNAQSPDTQNNAQTILAPQPPARPVKVAILLPLSGKHESLGQSMLKAAQLALFDINAPGFELIPEDTQGTAEGARKATQKAIQNGAELILGPLFAESVRASAPIAAGRRINLIGFSTDWTLAGRNTFIMGFLPFDQIDRLASYVAAKNIGRIGVIAPDTPYGNAVNSAYSQAAARYGLQTSARALIPPRTANISPILKDFTQFDARQEGGPLENMQPFEAVLMPTGGQQAADIANLITHYDLPPRDVKRLGTGLFDDRNLASERNLNGAWFAAPMPDLRRSFEQKYIATFGESAPRLATLAYDATALAAVLSIRGIRENGKPAFDRNNISNPNGFAGIDGIFRFRPDGTAERGLAILEFNKGQIRTIDPAPNTFQ